ncbi:hypothetical protein AQ490_10540 [Wenjunlia vitaminophila]|uniref:Hyaluronidase n=1 Tax=Wenjunlia vitaminophila TaxID=76728 RepID=A0A0T6LJT2_WENVI|nr:beta-N-acetylglucosaminidase domain-containing protein [Wenjunlia vitaminophila]KRV46355.1 hypothetical protein AQ490_10540 [Wenjunlia vitaminophila]
MHPRRSKSAVAGAAALAAAVIGSVIGVPTGAVAAPRPTPGTSSTDPSTAADAPSSDGSLSVYPRPQSLHQQGPAVRVTQVVTVVAGEGVDGTVLDPVREALTDAGARRVDVVRPGSAPASGLLVYAGGTEAARALRSLDAPSAIRLPAGGYVLASGQATLDGVPREVVAFAGRDPDGAFHAAQTLRQLAADGEVPGVVVRDWPTAPVRGTVEGFYGAPWTHAQRLAQLDFLGRTKQNRYLYAPGADPYRQTRWRQAYPRAQAVQFEALAERARRNHVVLAWAVSPGQSLCFSSAKDITALTSKLEAMWELGVRGFQLQFQDVAYDEWHCGADRDAFGTGPEAAAKAQARVANAVATWLNDRYGSAPGALSVLPTEYYQDGSSEYRAALADALDDDIEVAWTGVGVVPRTITGQELADARETFGHPLVTMDNYPVNDFADDRVFLGPTTGREPAVATTSTQVLANAGRQPVASRIALFTSADFAWNPRAYRAQDSWHAALRDLAGGDPAALRGLTTLARNSASSALDRRESAYLQPVIDAFWQALDEDPAGATHRTEVADLRSAFDDMADAPRRVEQVADGALARELRPWLDQLGRYGTAGRSAVDMLTAQGRDDGTGAWTEQVTVERLRKELRHGTATVGEGVLDPFLDRALDTADRWTGARADVRTPTTSMGAARDHEPPLMVDSSDDTAYWTDTAPQPGDTFGVDLGVAQPVTDVRIAMGGRGTAADDFLRDAVLEYDADDGSGWRQVPARTGKRTITATFPRGARAKEIRLRATSPQPTRVSVRAFIVNTPDTVRPEVTGGPAAGADHPLAAAADGDRRLGRPRALTVRFGAPAHWTGSPCSRSPGPGEGHRAGAHPRLGLEDLGRLGTGWTELDGGAPRPTRSGSPGRRAPGRWSTRSSRGSRLPRGQACWLQPGELDA